MLILLAVSLSLDAFAVSIAYGFKTTHITLAAKLVICIISITYFTLAVWLGDQISSFFSVHTAKVIGIILMSVICLWMLLQVLCNKKGPGDEAEVPKTLVTFSLKTLGLTFQVIKNPMLSDVDQSNSIGPAEALFLGTALSVDSISIGIGYSLSGTVHIIAPLLVGGIQFLFLCLGNWLGLKCTTTDVRISDRLQIISVAVMFILVLIRVFN